MQTQPYPTTPAPLPTTAPGPSLPPAQAFAAGNAISRSFHVWWKNVIPFTLMSLAVYAPLVVGFGVLFRSSAPTHGAVEPPDPRRLFAGGAVFFVAWLVTMALAVVQFGAVTHAAVQQLRGQRARLRDMLATGVRRSLPLAGMMLVGSLAIGVGLFLLVIPGIMLLVVWSVAVPSAVLERNGPLAALSRSSALTRGHRWQVFAVFLALVGIVWVLALFVQLAGVAVTLLLPRGLAAVAPLVMSVLGNAFFSALPAVGTAVVYHDLRAAKEGIQTDQLVAVFE
jgi:hypothetical protein